MVIPLGWLLACASPETRADPQDTATTDTAAPDTGDTGDTGVAPPPGYAQFGLTFVIGPDNRTFVPGILPNGETIAPTVWVAWGTADWGGDPDDTERSCFVYGDLSGLTVTATPGEDFDLRLTLPDDLPVTTTCDGSAIDLSGFPGGDIVAASLPPGVDWQFQWGGPPSAGLSDWLTAAERAAMDDHFLGARIQSALVSNGGSDNVFVRAYQVEDDGTLTIEAGGSVPLLASELVLPDGAGAAQGAYSFTAPWLIRQ